MHKHEQQTLTAVVVVNTRSQNRLTITKLELVLVTRFVGNKVVVVGTRGEGHQDGAEAQ